MLPTIRVLAAMAAVACCNAVLAHTAWLEADSAHGEWRLMFGGHANQLEPADPDKLKTVDAFDAQGAPLPVEWRVEDLGIMLSVPGEPVLITLHYDNGIHSRTALGQSVEKPMTELPGAVRGVNAQKYGKTIVRWVSRVTQPTGQPMEVAPVSAKPPRAGEAMQVMVWLEGKPAAGVKVGWSEEDVMATTDERGLASFTPKSGFNKLWAGKRIERTDDPKFTQLSYEYALGFEVGPGPR